MILPAAQFSLSQPVDEEEEEGEGENCGDSGSNETQAEVAHLAAFPLVPPIAHPLTAGIARPQGVAALRGSAEHSATEDRQLTEAGAHLDSCHRGNFPENLPLHPPDTGPALVVQKAWPLVLCVPDCLRNVQGSVC